MGTGKLINLNYLNISKSIWLNFLSNRIDVKPSQSPLLPSELSQKSVSLFHEPSIASWLPGHTLMCPCQSAHANRCCMCKIHTQMLVPSSTVHTHPTIHTHPDSGSTTQRSDSPGIRAVVSWTWVVFYWAIRENSGKGHRGLAVIVKKTFCKGQETWTLINLLPEKHYSPSEPNSRPATGEYGMQLGHWTSPHQSQFKQEVSRRQMGWWFGMQMAEKSIE